MENLLQIEDIKPKMNNWSAKITVQEKLQATPSSKNKTTYQKFIFVDSKDSKVQGIMFNQTIPVMSPKLQVYKKYLISNAEVRLIPENFQSDGIDRVISIETVVEELTDEQSDMLQAAFVYTKFKDFLLYADSTSEIVGIGLSTRKDSVILIDPPRRETRQLKNWAIKNEKTLAPIVENKEYPKHSPHIFYQQQKQLIMVANLISAPKCYSFSYYFEHIEEEEKVDNLTGDRFTLLSPQRQLIAAETLDSQCSSSKVRISLASKFDSAEDADHEEGDPSSDDESRKAKKAKLG
ncbi:hypothetical protein ACH5RR_002743 [Cinchona calisaya]|uniref:Uncharacterized protein n=1 Tax=Cinchona calisaya TaxID=153742 RepID=A0ABD3ATF9_9GENT